MITLTDKGAEKVREFLSAQSAVAETAGLRVGVRGGGCSGFQYALAFDEQRDGDTVFEDKGIRLVVPGCRRGRSLRGLKHRWPAPACGRFVSLAGAPHRIAERLGLGITLEN